MSTDIYRIRVLAADPDQRKLKLRVFLVYYDWEGVPTDPSFFTRILWDEGDTRFGGGGPIGDTISVEQVCDEKWIDENTHRFIERVTKLSRRNDPLPKGETRPTFVYDGFKDEDVLTQGDYEVIVTEAKWMQHLKEGMVWQTTSYETKAKMPPGRETVLLDVAQADEAPTTLLGVIRKRKAAAAEAHETAVPAKAKRTTKTAVKKTAAKKTTKTAAKKTTKAAVKKNAAKTTTKTAVKKTAAKKTTKTAVKKTAAKKTTKAAAKKAAKRK